MQCLTNKLNIKYLYRQIVHFDIQLTIPWKPVDLHQNISRLIFGSQMWKFLQKYEKGFAFFILQDY